MRRPARGRGCEAGRPVSRSERETGGKLDRSRRVSANAVARNTQIFGRRRIIVIIDIIAVVEQVQNVNAEPQTRFLADDRKRVVGGKSVEVRYELGGSSIIKKKTRTK